MDIKALEAQVYNQLFPFSPTKAQFTQVEIIKAAISCYASKDVDGITYEAIAKQCKVSRPLVKHYYPKLEELHLAVAKYVRSHFQALAIEYLKRGKTPKSQLEHYILACFDWTQDFRDHVAAWLVFYHYCSVKPHFRDMHDELTAMGQKRIAAILEMGVQQKQFKSSNHKLNAKLIQLVITGMVVNVLTEKLPINLQLFKKSFVKLCLQIADQ